MTITIEYKDMVIPGYRRAVIMRSYAEMTCNASLFRRAAAEFRALGMTASAERCDERARHYENV